jgi:hypothetical protein
LQFQLALKMVSKACGRSSEDEGYLWDEASQGMKFDYEDIPAELVSVAAEEWREKMVEAAAESRQKK